MALASARRRDTRLVGKVIVTLDGRPMLLEQDFLDVALLLGAVLKEEYAGRAEYGVAVAHHNADRIEPITSADKRHLWFELQCLERTVAIANVWRI